MTPDNTWHGHNVQMYPSGLIGPRWGLRQITVNGSLTVPAANGPRGFATLGANLFIVTDRLRMAPLSTLQSGVLSTIPFAPYPATPSSWVTMVAQTDNLVYSLAGGAIYQHNLTAYSTAAITTPSTLSFIRRWGLYCVGVDAVTRYRLWFSQVSSAGFTFDTWPATNYYDIGDSEPITAIVPLYNTLFIGKRSGWWALTGVVGSTVSIRQVSIGDGPVDARGASATADNRVAYWPKGPNPAFFNGASSSIMLDHVTVPYNPTAAQAVSASPTGRTVLFGYDAGENSEALLIAALGGASYHQFPVELAGFAPDCIENGYGLPAGYVLAARQASVAGAGFELYAWRIDPDRPVQVTDALGSLGDNTTTPLDAGFSTRAHYDPQGRDVRVRSVTVRFRAWNVNAAIRKWARFGIGVNVVGPYDDVTQESSAQFWHATDESFPDGGQDLTARFAIGQQGFGAGFQIVVSEMAGVAIRDIVVGVDYRGQRT